jgi:nuclear pore complex protein Nup93
LYKRAVYCYLCKHTGDDESINDILDNVDDFLWFKLNVITFNKDPGLPVGTLSMLGESTAPLTFLEFQTKLAVDYGERYFIKNNRNPFIYLHVLLLTGQFELAIELLLKYESLVVHGVHMALALFEKRMLNVIKSPSSSQLIVPAGLNENAAADSIAPPKCFRRVNLASLLKMYTRKFEHTDCREALEYYFFLRNLHIVQTSGNQQSSRVTNYFAQYITELALETREFELLFGKLEKNAAIRRLGAIDKFTSEAEANLIIGLVAEEMESKGLLEEAVRLHDLSRDYTRVLELSNKLISQVLTEVNIANSSRDRIKSLVMSIATRYKTETTSARGAAVPKSVMNTFFLLTDLLTFFDFYHAEDWDVAYETLCKLQVLPQLSQSVELKVKDFIAYSEEVCFIFLNLFNAKHSGAKIK